MQIEGQEQQQSTVPETAQTAAAEPAAGAVEQSGSTEQQQASQGKEGSTEQQNRDEQGRFKPKVQQRIDEITRARHEAEREAAYWRERAMAGGSDGKAQSNPSAQQAPAKPTPDQYQDYAEYVEALTEWKADQKVREAMSARDADRAKEAEQKVQQTRTQAWVERQTAARAAMPDYDEVVGLSDIPIAPHVAETILDSEQGPALAYHLAKNPELAQRINSLPPLAAAREIGRLESSLGKPAAQTAASAKPVSNAPDPIKPIGAGRTNSTDPKNMSMDQYKAMRKQQGARWAR